MVAGDVIDSFRVPLSIMIMSSPDKFDSDMATINKEQRLFADSFVCDKFTPCSTE